MVLRASKISNTYFDHGAACLIGICALLLSACAPQTSVPTITARPTETPTITPTGTLTPSPLPPTPTLSPTALVPTMTPGTGVCSPLSEVEIPDMEGLVVNPFAPPRPGSDNPHQGVDIADIDPDFAFAREGLPVQAVMDGRVAGVIRDRFPYGNALLVETSLNLLSDSAITGLQIPTPAPHREGHPSLTCPQAENPPGWDETSRSLYLIYAHLKEPPRQQIGDAVTCGQTLNAIGSSGNSLNPHLHLELRVGPAGAIFESMAHYSADATPQEMVNYCLWRVSDAFQLLNPMRIFELQPE